MKQAVTLYLFVFSVIGMYAQNITGKDLHGKWDLQNFNMDGVILDVVKSEVRFSKGAEKELNQQAKEGLKSSMAETLEAFKGAYMDFAGNNVTVFLETPDNASYTLTLKDSRQYITIAYKDGTADDFEIKLTDKELHLTAEDDGSVLEFVYKKSK